MSFSRIRATLPRKLKGVRVVYAGPPPVTGLEAIAREEASYKRGYSDASDSYNQQIAEQRQEMVRLQADVLQRVEDKVSQFLDTVRDALPEVITAITRKLWAELELQPEQLKAIVDEALDDLVHKGEPVEVQLCPADLAVVRQYEGEFSATGPLRLTEDETLQHGDCVVKSRYGRVDARVATKFAKVERQLKGESL